MNKYKVLITGTTQGIGRAIAIKFLNEGHEVYGMDRQLTTIFHENYFHHVCDVRDKEKFPYFNFHFDIIINNAGTQNEDDININLRGVLNITETYLSDDIKSVLMIGSASAHSGDEFPEYVASKSGLLGYTKNIARRIAHLGATCNSLDFGGVITELNKPILEDKECWDKIMEVTPMKRWMEPEEAADWAYFVTVVNKGMTGECLWINNGEGLINNFVFPGYDKL